MQQCIKSSHVSHTPNSFPFLTEQKVLYSEITEPARWEPLWVPVKYSASTPQLFSHPQTIYCLALEAFWWTKQIQSSSLYILLEKREINQMEKNIYTFNYKWNTLKKYRTFLDWTGICTFSGEVSFKFSPKGWVKIIMWTVGRKAYQEDETASGKAWKGKEFDTL